MSPFEGFISLGRKTSLFQSVGTSIREESLFSGETTLGRKKSLFANEAMLGRKRSPLGAKGSSGRKMSLSPDEAAGRSENVTLRRHGTWSEKVARHAQENRGSEFVIQWTIILVAPTRYSIAAGGGILSCAAHFWGDEPRGICFYVSL